MQDDSTFSNPLLTVAALGERNSEESRRKALAVKAGMKRNAGERELSGGPRPYGYRWVGELIDGKEVSHLEVIPAEAAVVARMWTTSMGSRSGPWPVG